MSKYIYAASGDTMQQFFKSFAEARKAATSAPWTDGRVFRHTCSWKDRPMFAEEGKLVYTRPQFS